MRYVTSFPFSGVAHGNVQYPVVNEVVDIAPEHVAWFADLIACGWLTPAPDEPEKPAEAVEPLVPDEPEKPAEAVEPLVPDEPEKPRGKRRANG